MPQQVAAIRSVSKAYKVIKEISSQGVPWGEDYRVYSRIALKEFLEGKKEGENFRDLPIMEKVKKFLKETE